MKIYKCNGCGKIVEPKYEGDFPEDENYSMYYLCASGRGTPIRYNNKIYYSFEFELCKECMGEFLYKYHLEK